MSFYSVYGNSYNEQLKRFRLMHSEIIEEYQCIEFDLRRIYSAMVDRDFDDTMDELEDKNWGELLTRLKRLDNSDGKPYISSDDYELLDKIRERRNYWCHQCYLDFMYLERYEQEERLIKLVRQVENELNRTRKIQKRVEDIYLYYWGE